MSDADLTVAILREIRKTRTDLSDRIDKTRTELSAGIDQTNKRLDVTNERLSDVEETLKELATQQVILTRYVKNVTDRHEQRLDDHAERLARLEGRGEPRQ